MRKITMLVDSNSQQVSLAWHEEEAGEPMSVGMSWR